jgi:RimJ/RimL family protein N-acetyltransferase
LKKIIGKTILLREYCIDDAEYIFQWRNDKNTTIYMGKKYRNPSTLEQVKSSLENIIKSKITDAIFYAIANKETEEYIGGIDLTSIDPIDKTCIMSIVVGYEIYRNKGIASEAISLLMEIAFKKLHLHKIELNVFEKNIPAIKCYQKNGFIIEGKSRDHMIINDKYENLIRMGILESEYNK